MEIVKGEGGSGGCSGTRGGKGVAHGLQGRHGGGPVGVVLRRDVPLLYGGGRDEGGECTDRPHVDRVGVVDYLCGDDPYKQDWMTQRRQRVGLRAVRKSSLHGLATQVMELGRRGLLALGRSSDKG